MAKDKNFTTDIRACKYEVKEIDNEKTLVTLCMDCPIQGDIMTNIHCRKGVVSAIAREYNVSSILISGYLVTKFSGPSFEIFKSMADIYLAMDRASGRVPVSQNSRDDTKKKCTNCPFNPSIFFSKFKDIFLEDVSKSYDFVFKASDKISSYTAGNRECARCVNQLGGDVVSIFNEMEELRKKLLYEGYQIVTGRIKMEGR